MGRMGLVAGVGAMVVLSACEVAVTPMEPGRDDLSVDDFGGRPGAVIVDPAGCAVVVGSMADGYATWPGFWQSADCAKFVGDAPGPPWGDIPNDDRRTMDAVVAQPGGGFVAVGEWVNPGDDLVAAILVMSSPDGVEWDSRTKPATTATYQHATDLVLTVDGTYLMTGGEGSEALVWRSTDLTSWEAVPLPARAGEPAPLYESAYAIAQAPDGRLVVVGSSNQTVSSLDQDAAAWVSEDDGLTWTAASAEGAFAPTLGSLESASSVVARADGTLMAAGRIANRPALWSSTDGLDWTPLDTTTWPADSGIRELVADDGSVLAVGSVRTDAGYKGVVWRLPDGAGAWSETRLAGVGAAVDATPIDDDRVVVIGGNGYKAWSTILTF